MPTVAYVFDFLKVWDESVYQRYAQGTPEIRAAVYATYTTLKTLVTRMPGIVCTSTLVAAGSPDPLTFKVRLSTTDAAYIRVLGTP